MAEATAAAGERTLRRDQLVLVALLCALTLVCWAWSLGMAAQMEAGAAQGHHHYQHAQHAEGWADVFAMWAVMMAGMMVPPELRLWTRLLRLRSERAAGPAPLVAMGLFIGGYLGSWTAYSLAAALLQRRFQAVGLLDAGLALNHRALAGAVLLVAGAAQFSPLKRACLQRCRAPAAALDAEGEGPLAAASAGLRHGAISIGSCGALMLVLFVTGVMSPLWMTLVTALLVVEAAAPAAWRASAVAGGLLLAWGGWLLLV